MLRLAMRKKKHTTLPLHLLLGAVLFSVVNAKDYFDEPLVRFSAVNLDDRQDGDLFGYATVLHRIDNLASPRDFGDAIANTKVIVGAPFGTYPGTLNLPRNESAINNTGLVYMCPIQPGPCTSLSGDGMGNDIRLFDSEANERGEHIITREIVDIEEKSGQFMGATLVSTEEHFMACAPRWISLTTRGGPVDRTRVHGRCFLSERGLSDFVRVTPCSGGNSHIPGGQSYCLAGFSASVVEKEANTVSLFMGGPPFDDSNGAVFNIDVVDHEEPDDASTVFLPEGRFTSKSFGYTGVAVTMGNILNQTDKQLIYAIPKSNSYKGSVEVFSVETNTIHTNTIVNGDQVGEYFGSSIAVADFNGDGYDELIVGAPLYSTLDKIERGRVLVFMNNNTDRENGFALDAENPIIREGTFSNGRFGSAVVNIGDINDDGYEDIAVGAPLEVYDENSEGTVYIYYGAGDTGISEEPESIKSRDILDRISDIGDLKLQSFGYSLSSGVDVDANFYEDLVIGGYKSGAVVVLRALSRANVYMDIATIPGDRLDYDNKNCPFEGELYACFELVINTSFTGRGLEENSLDITVTVEEVMSENEMQRLFFLTSEGNRSTSFEGQFTISQMDSAENFTIQVFVENRIEDRGSNLTFSISLRSPDRQERDINGSQSLLDLREIPVLTVLPLATVEQELSIVACGDNRICEPSLELSVNSTRFLRGEDITDETTVVVGRITAVEVVLDYSTTNEDIVDAEIMLMDLSETVFDSSNIRSTILTEEASTVKTCSADVVVCSLQSRVSVSDGVQQVSIVIPVRGSLRPGDFSTSVTFTLQDSALLFNKSSSNNTVAVDFSITARSNIRISSLDVPPLVQYRERDLGEIRRYSDLGDLVSITSRLKNDGPSLIPNAQVVVYIPGQDNGTKPHYYLYPGQVTANTENEQGGRIEAGIRCSGLNPDGLEKPENFTSRRKRRDISMMSALRELMSPQPEKISVKKRVDNVIDCSMSKQPCHKIECQFLEDFIPGTTITLVVNLYVDERLYQRKGGDHQFFAHVVFSIKDDFIEGDPAMATTDAFEVVKVKPRRSAPIPIWVYVVSIIGALAVLVFIIFLLYLVGFFRLRRKEERIAREKERRRSISAGAVTATVVPPGSAREEVDLDSKPEAMDNNNNLDEKPELGMGDEDKAEVNEEGETEI